MPMCDEDTLQDAERFRNRVTRRTFNKMTVAGLAASVVPGIAATNAVTEQDVMVTTPDGQADCYFVHPESGKHAGVILWPDIFGLRPAFRTMGKRLARAGYSVLVVNPYYRNGKALVLPPDESYLSEEARGMLFPLARTLSIQTINIDARAFVSWLDGQAAVDSSRKMGTLGYCMTGPFTLRTAAVMPERVGATASFHGGGLVTDDENSPHFLLPSTRAHALIAIAENDHKRSPQVMGILRQAYADAGLPAEIEVYEGAMHGWCPPDTSAYSEEHAERAWQRLLVLFEKALA
jgi:carboxymethylenebutenolidase